MMRITMIPAAIACWMLASSSAAAEDLNVVFDLSNPDILELTEPLQMSCLRTSIAAGQTQDEAFAALPDCLSKRFLSAIELERAIRAYYPSELSPEALSECIRETDEDRALLPCARSKAR